MKVLVDDHKNGGRKVVEVEVVKRDKKSLWVRLPDGNVIQRKVPRDIPEEVS